MAQKNNINKIKKPYSIGIIGGGQLALMLVEAAKKRGIKVCIQTSSLEDPASPYSDFVIEADPLLLKANKHLIRECDKVIFENEWIRIDKLKELESDDLFIPRLEALEPLVDRISQKKFIEKLNLPTPKWISLESYIKKKEEFHSIHNFPLMAKSFKGGYDGKGNKKIRNKEDLKSFIDKINSDDWLLEEWVDFDKEFALVGSRDKNGKIRLFPLVETFQSNNVCDWVLTPAKTNYDINLFALNIFSSIVNELDYVGVLGIEFFFGNNGLLINEIAPRTHNSAHFSIEACTSSQFDQQICISNSIEAPEILMKSHGSIMVNLLGLKKEYSLSLKERLKKLSELDGANLHWYGKSREEFGRKMGHITFLLDEKNYEQRLQKSKTILKSIREIWPSPYLQNLM
tara:strand:- start:64 stop:1266 length:1203 start_codon:yes stop_codon:yes gene_type:complete